MNFRYKYRIITETRLNGSKTFHAQCARDWIKSWPNCLRLWGALSIYGTKYCSIEDPHDTYEDALRAVNAHKTIVVNALGNVIISTEIEYL